MKKTFSAILALFIVSFVLHASGMKALPIHVIVGFELPTWHGGAEIATLTKTVDSVEKLEVATYMNRNLQARIISSSGYAIGDSGYAWSVTINSSSTYATRYIDNDQNSSVAHYANFPGVKTLYLRTSGYWASTTTTNGTWYVNG